MADSLHQWVRFAFSASTVTGEARAMEISLVGSIRTPFGEVELIPQDCNLLQVSSVEPLHFGDLKIHLWAMLERMHETWGISGTIAPVLHLIDRFGHRTLIASESIPAELIKSATSLAGEWAVARPEVFEGAAAAAFEFDKVGLERELGALSESLTCSAQAIESITSEASSENTGQLRKYSQKLRSMAFELPAMQKIARAISYPDKNPSRPTELLRIAPIARTTVFRQSQLSSQLTIGPVSKEKRNERGLSQESSPSSPDEGSAPGVKT
jgi:hypothetical protein